MSELIFNIVTERLTGKIGALVVDTRGVAGGRAGSKTPGAENWSLSGNPLATHVGGPVMSGTHIFGPLPVGRYQMFASKDRANWIALTPLHTTQTFGRSGFAIHGRGPTGSHGCIVLADFTLLTRLYHLVLHLPPSLPPAELQVIAVGQDLDKKIKTA